MVSANDAKIAIIKSILARYKEMGDIPIPLIMIHKETGIGYTVIRNILNELGYDINKETLELPRITTVAKKRMS